MRSSGGVAEFSRKILPPPELDGIGDSDRENSTPYGGSTARICQNSPGSRNQLDARQLSRLRSATHVADNPCCQKAPHRPPDPTRARNHQCALRVVQPCVSGGNPEPARFTARRFVCSSHVGTT